MFLQAFLHAREIHTFLILQQMFIKLFQLVNKGNTRSSYYMLFPFLTCKLNVENDKRTLITPPPRANSHVVLGLKKKLVFK